MSAKKVSQKVVMEDLLRESSDDDDELLLGEPIFTKRRQSVPVAAVALEEVAVTHSVAGAASATQDPTSDQTMAGRADAFQGEAPRRVTMSLKKRRATEDDGESLAEAEEGSDDDGSDDDESMGKEEEKEEASESTNKRPRIIHIKDSDDDESEVETTDNATSDIKLEEDEESLVEEEGSGGDRSAGDRSNDDGSDDDGSDDDGSDDDESDDDESMGKGGEEASESTRKRPRIIHIKDSDDVESEEETTDDDESNEEETSRSTRPRKKFATLEQAAWLGGGNNEYSGDEGSEEEEELEFEEGFHRSELVDTPISRRSRRRSENDLCAPPSPPAILTPQRVQDMLHEIQSPMDMALQKLLIDACFRFQLMKHQFLAVRKIAGTPATFPLHPGSQVTEPATATMAQAICALDSGENECKTHGVLIADEMGLGKTVEAIAGAILRNALAAAKGEKERPTVIISPNHAVQVQWRDTLVKNGVPIERIIMFDVGQNSVGFDKAVFLLMTRYTVQGEVKKVFGFLDDQTMYPLAISSLFPHATISNLKSLKVQYQDENTKERVRNDIRQENESITDCVTRLINLCTKRMKQNGAEPIFETLIIDEAHFLKNITTFWGMGAALISTHALRSAPLTGTPYNNGPSDLAAVMTFIDAAKHSARKGWWSSATSEHAGESIRNRVKIWHETFLVRRRKEDVLKDLVPKRVMSQLVSQYSAEQTVYDCYEGRLQCVLKEFSRLVEYADNPIVREQVKDLFTMLMALMSSMRSANIHAMLPGGREYTKQFSPSRQHLRSMEERRKACVCCDLNMRPSIPLSNDDDEDENNRGKRGKRRRLKSGTNVDELEEGKDNNDDAVDMVAEEDEELVPIPASLCEARNSGVSHFAHAHCLEKMKNEGDSCPRCKHAKNTMQYELPNEGTVYCPHIGGGFVGSSKINAVVEWYRNKVPKDDKVLILSFFKGGLDLLEGIFQHDFSINVARFDGDVQRHVSLSELQRFQREENCKILLATVQSGGVGLNIVEANHVCFLDRWYNPFVHQQAEDRVHRIGQTKEVFITYFDCAATIDQAMVELNKQKKENSAILLADGFEIGNRQSLSYKELSGLLGNLLHAIRSFRTGWIEASPENKNSPIPPVPADVLANALEGRLARNLVSARGSPGGDADETEKQNAYSRSTGIEDFIVDDSEEEDEFESADESE